MEAQKKKQADAKAAAKATKDAAAAERKAKRAEEEAKKEKERADRAAEKEKQEREAHRKDRPWTPSATPRDRSPFPILELNVDNELVIIGGLPAGTAAGQPGAVSPLPDPRDLSLQPSTSRSHSSTLHSCRKRR